MTLSDVLIVAVCGALGFAAAYWLLSRRAEHRNKHSYQGNEFGFMGAQSDESDARATSGRVKEWYKILDVDPTADDQAIAAAYKAKIKQYHPDRVSNLGPEFLRMAEARTKEINVAYENARSASRRPS